MREGRAVLGFAPERPFGGTEGRESRGRFAWLPDAGTLVDLDTFDCFGRRDGKRMLLDTISESRVAMATLATLEVRAKERPPWEMGWVAEAFVDGHMAWHRERVERCHKAIESMSPKPIAREGERLDKEAAKRFPIKEMVEFSRGGFAKCLWHEERTGSMKLYPDNHVHCFSCGRTGDAIDVAMAVNGTDFMSAMRILLRK